MLKISLITIGTELLKGRIINTNAAKIGEMLRPHGFKLSRTVVIPDTAEAIRKAVLEEMSEHDVVLTSGGLGPTQDDMTKHVLADLFDSSLVLHAETLAHIAAIFSRRNRPLTERNRQQAMLPEKCEVIPNPRGTAPGMLFREAGKWMVSMPGVPFEMLYMTEHEIIPRLKAERQQGVFMHQILRLSHIPESHAADRMEPIESMLPEMVEIAYLPRIDGLWLEMYIDRMDVAQAAAQKALEEASVLIYEQFRDKYFAWGDQPLPAIVADELTSRSLTLAVAESITGGQIAASLVSISGASDFFKGSITAYATEIKEIILDVDPEIIQQHGVVSEAVASLMAIHVRSMMRADIGIATTGYAEPDDEIIPQVWIGYSDGLENKAEHVYLHGDRNVVIGRAVSYALQFCLRQVRKGHRLPQNPDFAQGDQA